MKQFVIIGLGNFGYYLAAHLYKKGYEVLAIDISVSSEYMPRRSAKPIRVYYRKSGLPKFFFRKRTRLPHWPSGYIIRIC
jgi:ketopantoate reductase